MSKLSTRMIGASLVLSLAIVLGNGKIAAATNYDKWQQCETEKETLTKQVTDLEKQVSEL